MLVSKLEIRNLQLGNTSTFLYFPQFLISDFTTKIQDQQSVNYFWNNMKDAKYLHYLVSERKLTKTVISSKARNLIILKIQALKISPYGRNDKKRGFRSGTI